MSSLADRLDTLPRAVLEKIYLVGLELKRRHPWKPDPQNTPQMMAYVSLADVVGFGGAAGGGKTDLACGTTITKHRKAMILRRVGTELTGIIDRLEELLGGRQGYNGQSKIWKTKRPDKRSLQIEFASLPNLGDERGYQGRPHDLLIFDEAANFLEAQVRFLMGWCRTTLKDQICQVLMCFNPPTTAEGRWIVDFFGPWLNPMHPLYPAMPGQLLWCASDLEGKDHWVDGPEPYVWVKDADGKDVKLYDFDPKAYKPEEIFRPKSRTFIPSKVSDNRYLTGTGYMSTLQQLPEPLRSQMLNGDFQAGMTDDAMQVIPTAWVRAAMDRWISRDDLILKNGGMPAMDSLGVDVARGGADNTVIAPRYGQWYDKLKLHKGTATPNGQIVATHALMARKNQAPIHIDVIGVGSSPYDILQAQKVQVIGVNVSEGSNDTDKSGRLHMLNKRTALWWSMREALDPDNDTGVMLPPDDELLKDLTAPKWELRGFQIVVEGRDEIFKRIGRSVDRASAVLLASLETPNLALLEGARRGPNMGEYDPYRSLQSAQQSKDYDPYR